MIRLNGVRYSIGTRTLFDDVDWVVGPGDRVALVGPNGAGKTTLLKIALGEIPAERGTRVLSKGTRMGYLPQEAAERFDGTVLDRALDAHRHLIEMREELDSLYQSIPELKPDDPEMERLLDRAGELQHHLELHDEQALEPEARRVLAGLGFSTVDQDRPLSEFSGGWRMRAALAALLLTDPTALFLDEPTNHLDLPAMEWLEDYLEDFHGGLVVVSHDRVFLDRVTTEIRELDHEVLSEYAMTFTEYLEEREARRERIAAQNVQLDKKIAQLERFAERFGAKNTKAAQAHSKRKQAERLRQRRVVLPRKPRTIRFQFPMPPHVGRVMVQLKDASFAYDERDIFHDANLEIQKGEKIAIVGANGAGKTTLLRVLAGQLDPREGEREIHPQAKLGYFAQHAAEILDGKLTVLEAVEEVASDEMRLRLRSLLGNFLFIGDDVFKRCSILSGGERQRVAITRLLLKPSNLILLDEPTHHLDLAGKEVLEEALIQYPGAVVVVTHDRSLMARLATRILAVEDGRVVPYPGGYDDYESARVARAAAAKSGSAGATPARATAKAAAKAEPGAAAARSAKAAPSAAKAPAAPATKRRGAPDPRKRKQEEERLTREVEVKEAELKKIEAALADPGVYADGARTKELLGRYEAARKDVDALWVKLAEVSEPSGT
ncbi:MAG TPA: ABC-F family ATP-binding cassette domain-containing protein [Candidatus Limnocylindrales bacterium]|nr:ABC-F family ATP-binding cassette domain-containing protein [Candidatus Limnocylindrales bacterium]